MENADNYSVGIAYEDRVFDPGVKHVFTTFVHDSIVS